MQKLPLTLTEHQQILYDILYMLDDFCTKYQIRYFLVGGSLLGAVRHQGIIPWDDDIDVGMERSEYERFIVLFQQNMPQGYCLLSINNTPGYTLPFAKVGRLGTMQYEVSKNIPASGIPVNIDILPQDGCPGETEADAIAYFNHSRNLIQGVIWWRYNEPLSLKPGHWRNSFRVLRYRLRYPSLASVRKVYNSAKQYAARDCKYYACIVNGIYGQGEVEPTSSITGKLPRMAFGNRKLPVPALWHDYLTGLYGDYMTPFPPKKQKRHVEDGCSYRIIKDK